MPLHEGTRAAVRSIGLSGVANRFVDLVPGPPSTAEIPDGGVLPTTHTRGVVDLDALLNAVDPAVRRDIQGIVRDAAVALTPRTAEQTNAGLEMLNPALSRLTALGRELTRDEAALRSLLPRVAALSRVARRAARRRSGAASSAGADVFSALAARARRARRPARARARRRCAARRATLRAGPDATLPAVDPLLRASRPAIGPLADVVREVEPTLTQRRAADRAAARADPGVARGARAAARSSQRRPRPGDRLDHQGR